LAKVLKIAQNQGILGLEGFTGVVGEPLFLAFFDAADKVGIGGYNLAKPRLLPKSTILPKGLRNL